MKGSLFVAASAFLWLCLVVVTHAHSGFSSWGWVQNVATAILGAQTLVWLFKARSEWRASA